MNIAVDEINPNLLKTINKLAKINKTSESKIIEEALEKGLEIMRINEEYDCEAFGKEIDRRRARIEAGEGIEISMNELAERLGVDNP